MGNHPSHMRWREANKDHIKKYNRMYSAKLRQTRTEHWLVLRARSRAKRDNLPFDLTADDITIPLYCPVLGIPLYRNINGNKPGANSPSIDRIVPSLGYVKTNICVISHRANILKRDATVDELERLYKYVKDNS
jgi:hypothetical protein